MRRTPLILDLTQVATFLLRETLTRSADRIFERPVLVPIGAAAEDVLLVDLDDDGRLDVADAVMVLRYLYQRGVEPPPPAAGQCGPGLTSDELGYKEVCRAS